MQVTMAVTQRVTVAIQQPVDKFGNPAAIDGLPVWGTNEPDKLDVVVAGDGMSAVISAKGPMGTAQVTVTGDADLGEGRKEIVGVLDFNLLAGEATGFAFNVGAPEAIPEV